ncbi:hypothetical protein [Salinivibrio proteolyticus]|uniref:hypothetical protein n=1 Tax=Salinivibrio proteolyticus TaxID=334715 RepID=UPI000988FA39|nr:hypothetical protein [Salinivibrio proteolyticus]OOF30502.1 hypothetical protein BZJ20_10210 [Salinivibrio proteolyticus]
MMTSEMTHWLQQLEAIDEAIAHSLAERDADPEKLAQQLHDRKALLDQIAASSEQPDGQAWAKALSRTEQLVQTLDNERADAAKTLLQQRKGKQSVQLYKKFQ